MEREAGVAVMKLYFRIDLLSLVVGVFTRRSVASL